jgi:hypothetical protein
LIVNGIVSAPSTTLPPPACTSTASTSTGSARWAVTTSRSPGRYRITLTEALRDRSAYREVNAGPAGAIP